MWIREADIGFEVPYEKPRITNEELQREYDFLLAEQLTKKLLDAGMITQDEYERIRKLNIQTFKPFLSKLMPDK